MKTPQKLRPFVERVFAINPTYTNVFGGNLPGMGHTAVATSGAISSSTDIINKLRHVTAQFAELLSSNGDHQDIHLALKEIEGCLLSLQTLGGVGDSTVESLIDQANDLATVQSPN